LIYPTFIEPTATMPIGFELTQDQRELQELAARFAKNEMLPRAAECDKKGLFPEEVYRKAWELGLMNLNVATEWGGSGLPLLDQCLITEELAHACAGMTTSILANCLALQPINLAGTKEQKEKFLKPFCAQYNLASFALTEPGGGSDAGALKTRATLKGDHYVLDGEKCFITNAPHASLYTVFATVDPAKKHAGITAFIVPRSTPGVTPGKDEDKMGQRASSTSVIRFEGAEVPVENRLGKEGEGFRVAMATLDSTRTPIGALATGIAQAALDYAAKYSLQRTSFGKPLAEHQAIAIKLANMAQDIAAARLLVWHSAWLVDQGNRASLNSSIAKCFSSDMAMRVCDEAIQIFGGYGYMRDYPVEKLLRDAKLCQIYEGANEIQRLVISRELLQKYG
jgi:acyl-CoA dehydrogenase